MAPKLTDEMREALQRRPGQPVTVEDEHTHHQYVLLPLDLYRKLRDVLGDDELDVTETYAAQSDAAGASGWDDPDMDIYNDYDAHRPQS